MGNCSICKTDKKLITHHLSYEPEIIITMCWKCHTAMHRLAEINKEYQVIIINFVNQYGHLWKNGHEKHLKTEHWKKYQKEFNKNRYENKRIEILEHQKKYNENHRAERKEYRGKYYNKNHK